MPFERHEHGFGYRDPDELVPPLDENNPRQPPHLRIGFVVGSQDQATADAMWAAMVAVAAEINARDLNYNFLFQNSNSAFNTLALAAGLDDHDSGFAPGQNRNLLDVNEENQPFVLSLGQEGFVFGSGGSDIIIGRYGIATQFDAGEGDDAITGGSAYDFIDAGAGNDTIIAYGGFVTGGSGDDVISSGGNSLLIVYGDEGNDQITGSSVDDKLDGGSGDDWVIGGDGADLIHGRAGNDNLSGNEGDDKLVGSQGNDFIDGGSGNDEIYGGDGADFILGGDGDDFICGGTDSDLRSQDYGQDTIYGGAGNDTIFGSLEVDHIYGGDGDDIIAAAWSGDQIWGNAGADIFMITYPADSTTFQGPTPYYGVDVIQDFEVGIDRIDLRPLNANGAYGTVSTWQSDGSTFVGYDIGNDGIFDMTIQLMGTHTLSSSDFLI